MPLELCPALLALDLLLLLPLFFSDLANAASDVSTRPAVAIGAMTMVDIAIAAAVFLNLEDIIIPFTVLARPPFVDKWGANQAKEWQKLVGDI